MPGTRNQGHTTSPPPSAPCPVSAVCQALRAAVHQSPKAPAFPVSGAVFDKKLKAVTQGEGNLSGHSFRRGGACWAPSQNIPGEIIKIMGDWKSTVYMSYLDQLPQPVLDHFRVVFFPTLSPVHVVKQDIEGIHRHLVWRGIGRKGVWNYIRRGFGVLTIID